MDRHTYLSRLQARRRPPAPWFWLSLAATFLVMVVGAIVNVLI